MVYQFHQSLATPCPHLQGHFTSMPPRFSGLLLTSSDRLWQSHSVGQLDHLTQVRFQSRMVASLEVCLKAWDTYSTIFKISVLAELESGKPLAQVAREYAIHPSLPCRWKAELSENLRCAQNMPVSTWKWDTNPGRRNTIMENARQLRVYFHLLGESWGNLSLLPRHNKCFMK